MKKAKKIKAFSLIELSIVILVMGVFIGGIVQGRKLIYQAKLTMARTLSQSSPVASISDLILWMDVTNEGSLTSVHNTTQIEDADRIRTWRDVNPQMQYNLEFSSPTWKNRPRYRAFQFNGLPTLEFDGEETLEDGDYMATPGETRINQPHNFSIFIVFAPIPGNDNTAQGILAKYQEGDANSPYAVTYRGNNDKVLVLTMSEENLYRSASNPRTLDFEKASIITTTHNSKRPTNGFNLAINGKNGTPSDSRGSIQFSNEELRIGRQKDFAPRACKCYISEIIMYDRVLKNSEIDSIEEYLSQKWSIILED